MAIKVLKNREGQKVGLKKPLQKLPFSSHAPRGEHEIDDAGDDEQRHPGTDKIDPADGLVPSGLHFTEGVKVDEKGDDFAYEKDPFRSPTEDEDVDQYGGGGGRQKGDRKPDPHPGEPAENHGQQQKKLGVLAGVVQDGL
ncbi:hypothetical protein DSCW_65580 [Desulfosarcina widdelii]|uniref:Uncharacterized protein n=1 Tax=Desulfosarcina widdelii TaxID=947919 RepID=A0A5K7ZH53_9BACT|nr:hypothetical protein DSCW_65580 [Desulfosarcina widdelii]